MTILNLSTLIMYLGKTQYSLPNYENIDKMFNYTFITALVNLLGRLYWSYVEESGNKARDYQHGKQICKNISNTILKVFW